MQDTMWEDSPSTGLLHDVKPALMRQDIERLQAEKAAPERSYRQEKACFVQQQLDLQQASDQRIDSEQQQASQLAEELPQTSTKLAELQQERDRQCSFLKQQHGQLAAQMRQQHQQELNSVKQGHSEQIAQMQQRHQQELNSLSTQYRQKLHDTEEHYLGQLDSQRLLHDHRVQGLQQQLQDIDTHLQLLRQATLGGSQNYSQVAGAVLGSCVAAASFHDH
jgi:exonuclease VII large subunit